MRVRHLLSIVLGTACGMALVSANAGVALAGPSGIGAYTAQTNAATRRLAVTERKIPPRLYSYYTVGTKWRTVNANGWTAGYLPGELWMSYSLTGDSLFKSRAAIRQDALVDLSVTSSQFDIGHRYYYSLARGYQLTGNSAYKSKALTAASMMSRRYNHAVGAIRSRETIPSCEVVIDELMSVELLWWAADNGGSPALRRMARQHTLTAARDFVRPDGSTYHLVSYDAKTGAVLARETRQGYSNDSTWARGQAWAIHGFTAGYRETRDPILLATARKVGDRYLADLPADNVPYWDFKAPGIPNEPRDSSAAAVAASGLLDLATLDPLPENRVRYEAAARAILDSLATPAYRSSGGNPAILLHGTMNWYSPATRDVGLSFGDYFYLEALQRLRRMPETGRPIAVRRIKASTGVPARVLDGSARTWWSAKGKQWIRFDLGARKNVNAVRVSQLYGTSRSAGLSVHVSNDAKHWRFVRAARTSGETSSGETYAFAPVHARYVRLSFNGTTRGNNLGITEARVY